MNERLKDILHRWLPKLAILSVLVMLFSYLFAEYYVRPRFDTAAEAKKEEHDKSHQLLQGVRQAKAREARAALERLVSLIDTLDGNRQTQEALNKAVAQEESIGEVWVANAQGLIVYYGRHNPPVRNVADFPLNHLTEILDMLPKDLLSPIQRTAILLSAEIRGYRHGGPSSLSFSSASINPKEKLWVYLQSDTLVEMARVKDGLIAIAVAPARLPPGTLSLGQLWEKKERLRLWLNIFTLVALVGFILFWLSIPAWMTLDAQKKRERAAVWGFFGLLGNMIALVVYLLVRENGQPSENS
ncbi:MAG: hypothetical protein OXH81_25830 [Gemmatimonadetes bacterium]|nr:hypothetical protein [Gemmatimonadota bacterium]